MTLHEHEPISEAEMRKRPGPYTVCRVLRDIYFSTDNEHIKLKCRVATSMTKAMTKKLFEYNKLSKSNKPWDKEFW